MAISIVSSPQAVQPVYSPLWFNVTSTNTAQPNFKYVFKLYTGTTATGTPLATTKLLARPVTANCLYNPSRILETVLSYDSNIQNIISATTSHNHITNYVVNFGEEYGLLSTGTTIYSGLSSATSYTFNGVNQYQEIPSWQYQSINMAYWNLGTDWSFSGNSIVKVAGNNSQTIVQAPMISGRTYSVTIGQINVTAGVVDLILGSNTIVTGFSGATSVTFSGVTNGTQLKWQGYTTTILDFDVAQITIDDITNPYNPIRVFPPRFLTNQPQDLNVKNDTDRGTLSFLDTELKTRYWNVWVTEANGNIAWTQFSCNAYTGNTPDNRIIHIPSGPWNINNVPASERIFGATGTTQIIKPTDTAYLIFLEDITGLNSEYRRFNINKTCSKFETVRLQFLNRLGGFDYVNFDLVSKKTINNINKGTYTKALTYDYVIGDRGKTVIDMNAEINYSVLSDWMSDEESAWMEELVTSPEVYIINSDGTAWPVIIKQNSLTIQKKSFKKLIQYGFDLETSFKVNTQRG